MIEVTHGPCTVDNNILLSDFALDNHAQGTAYVHNIFAGSVRLVRVLNRCTPYHFPHTTEVAGYLPVYGGDDRLYNNIVLGQDAGRGGQHPAISFGSNYNSYCTYDEYPLREGATNRDIGNYEYEKVMQPVWIESNAYSGHAFPFRAEKNATVVCGMTADIEKTNGKWVLTLNIPEEVLNTVCAPVTTERLGTPRVTEEPYENPDGTPIDFTLDFHGENRVDRVLPGPFATLKAGKNKFIVW